jgi:hypothetical protein
MRVVAQASPTALGGRLTGQAPDARAGFGTWNIGAYSNPRIDAVIQRSLETLDADRRHEIQVEAVRMAMEE